MAAVIGLSTGSADIFSLVVRMGKTAKMLHDVRKVIPEELARVGAQVEALHQLISQLSEIPGCHEIAFQLCRDDCDKLLEKLGKLEKIFRSEAKQDMLDKLAKAASLRNWERDLTYIENAIRDVKLNLTLALSTRGLLPQVNILADRPSSMVKVAGEEPESRPRLVLLEFVWSANDQLDLLELLMREFGITRGRDDVRFLTQCATWIGEGPHLPLLNELLDYGFDVNRLSCPNVLDWPQPCSPNWISEEQTRDPFFIKYISILCEQSQGFGGMTPLHEAVVFGTDEAVHKWLLKSEKDQKNFLGQTPIHFAAAQGRHLDSLIAYGHNLDAVDYHGNTPLMYATAMNQAKSVMLLLDSGANPGIRENNYHRLFMDYAASRGHWRLLLDIIDHIKAMIGEKLANPWAEKATIRFHLSYSISCREENVSLGDFLSRCSNANFTFSMRSDQGGTQTLLHKCKSVEDIEELISAGFKNIDQRNSLGQTALMCAISRQVSAAVISKLIQAGADVNLKDEKGCTVLQYALRNIGFSLRHKPSESMEILSILLRQGVELYPREKCRCPCSPDGFAPDIELDTNSDFSDWWGPPEAPIWWLEWITQIYETRGEDDARTTLLALLRRFKHKHQDVSHVHCPMSLERDFFWDNFKSMADVPQISEEDIDDILEEESDFIESLEKEMTLVSNFEYHALMNELILCFKIAVDGVKRNCEAQAKAMRRTQSPKPEREVFKIDRKNDRFIPAPLRLDWTPVEGYSYGTRELSAYVSWLAYQWFHGGPAELDEPAQEQWLVRRVSWIRFLLDAFEISLEDIFQKESEEDEPGAGLQNKRAREHLRSSWAKYQTKS
ncbi:unnamed protein product [Clonostachys chloroleuca]|uniref:Uncharacterized protein n=1 Tax=Clonostachys chloroleuca TaxID=1926264 RepID=A0AA35M7X4_9HYPO|nr:unnamed protein product [Clonostachys chloroleuca]